MNTYELIANNTVLDTNNNIDISITYSIDDILDISKRNTSWTKTIVLPGTPVNNKFFSHLYDVNIDAVTFNLVKRLPVIIRIGTNDVMTGYMQLLNINIENKEISYEVSIAGVLSNIISTLGDYSLGDIDMSEYNHTRTKQAVIDSWDYNIYKNEVLTDVNGPGDGYVYPYIINGNSADIWTTLYTYDSFPAVYAKTIMDNIFEFAGFTYTSNFFNSEYFSKLILPYTGDKIEMAAEVFQERVVIAGVNDAVDYISMTPAKYKDSGWYYNDVTNYSVGFTRESGTVDDTTGELTFTDELGQWDGNQFTTAKTGRYNITFNATVFAEYDHDDGDDVEFKQGEFKYRYQMFLVKASGSTIQIGSSQDINDPLDIYGEQTFQPSSGQHPTPWIDIDTPLTFNMRAENVFMEVGDKVIIRYGFEYNDSVEWQGLNNDNKISARLLFKKSYNDNFSRFEIEPATSETFGDDYIDMNQILDSTIKMKDFFLDISKMFNLVIQDNPNKVNDIIIEPRDEFYQSKQKVLDWDAERKLDNDSLVKITPMSELDAKSYLYTYSSDDDWLNKEYQNETKRIYGDYRLDVQNDFSEKTTKTEVMFAPSPSGEQFIDSRKAVFFAEYDGETYKPKKVKPRILFYGGEIDLYSGSTLTVKSYPEDSTPEVVTRYAYAGMWDSYIDPMYSLEFGRPQKMYFNTSVYPNQNLYEKFHKSTLNNIIDRNSKLLECTVKLSPRDIATFDFRDIVFLLGSYWRVVKIENYNPIAADALTKVILYKIVDIDIISKYQVNIPTSNKSCPVDMITVASGKKKGMIISKSGQEITEDCCKQVGGNWLNGVCSIDYTISEVKGKDIKNKITGGLGMIPTSEKTGPVMVNKNGNSINSIEAKVFGSGNYVPPGTKNTLIVGDNNSVSPNMINTVVFGNGITAYESNALYTPEKLIVTGSTTGVTPTINNIAIPDLDIWSKSGTTDSVVSKYSNHQIDSGSTFSIMAGGYNNIISASTIGVSIIGGHDNLIDNGIDTSSIIGGYNNLIEGNSDDTILLGTTSSTATTGSVESIIAGGYQQLLDAAPDSAIIGGGENSIVGADATVVLGGYNIAATASETVYVPNLNVNYVPQVADETEKILVRAIDGTVKESLLSLSAITATSGLTWSDVLTNGNESGGNDAVISNTDRIVSEIHSGGGYPGARGFLTFDYEENGTGIIMLCAEDGGNDSMQLTLNPSSGITINSDNILPINIGTGGLVNNSGALGINMFTGTLQPGVSQGYFNVTIYDDIETRENIIYVENNIVNNITTTATDKPAIFIGTNNSTIDAGVVNSVIIGGFENLIESSHSLILGGDTNQITDVTSAESVICAGFSNIIDASGQSFIAAGAGNNIINTSNNSVILAANASTLDGTSNSAIIATSASGVISTFDYTLHQSDSYRDCGNHTLQTTNNTTTTIYSFTPNTNGVWIIEANTTGFESATGDAIGAKSFATFKVIAGAVTAVSTNTLDRKSNFPAGVTVLIDTDGTVIRIRVTGRTGSTIDWRSSLTITK